MAFSVVHIEVLNALRDVRFRVLFDECIGEFALAGIVAFGLLFVVCLGVCKREIRLENFNTTS